MVRGVSLGLTFQQGGHLGPHRDDCRCRGSRRQVRLSESKEEAKLGLMHNELLHSIDWDPEGSGNYISILKTLAFLSQFLRKLILEVLLVTKHLEQTLLVPYPKCLPLMIGLNNKGTGLLTSHPMPSPHQNRHSETVPVKTSGYSWRDSVNLCHSMETGSQEGRGRTAETSMENYEQKPCWNNAPGQHLVFLFPVETVQSAHTQTHTHITIQTQQTH